MAYDKEYYENRKKVLDDRFNKNKNDFINKVLNLTNEFVQDQNVLQQDYREIETRKVKGEEKIKEVKK